MIDGVFNGVNAVSKLRVTVYQARLVTAADRALLPMNNSVQELLYIYYNAQMAKSGDGAERSGR